MSSCPHSRQTSLSGSNAHRIFVAGHQSTDAEISFCISQGLLQTLLCHFGEFAHRHTQTHTHTYICFHLSHTLLVPQHSRGNHKSNSSMGLSNNQDDNEEKKESSNTAYTGEKQTSSPIASTLMSTAGFPFRKVTFPRAENATRLAMNLMEAVTPSLTATS